MGIEEVVVLKGVVKSPETTPILRPAGVKMRVVFQPLKIEITELSPSSLSKLHYRNPLPIYQIDV